MTFGAGVRGRTIRVRLLVAPTPPALEAALQLFLAELGEEMVLSIEYRAQPTDYTALVVFTR